MDGKTFWKRPFRSGGWRTEAGTEETFVREPAYLTSQETVEIIAEIVEVDDEGQFIPPVGAPLFGSQCIYVALATSFSAEQKVLSCAGLCYIQLLDSPGQAGWARVAALPSHLSAASSRKRQCVFLSEEQLRLLLPWDRTLQRLETCCVRDVLQVYAALVSGREVSAHPHATTAEELPARTCTPASQKIAADTPGEALPEQVFVPADIALELARQFQTGGHLSPKSKHVPLSFWLKALVRTLEGRLSRLSTFETMLLRMARHLKEHWSGSGRTMQIQATPVRKEKACLGWSLLLAFSESTLRAWGF